ncbi:MULTISPECIES: hypothetical protein [unclassified Mesorhizobium]|uniref:hypothetical protein n=1 Tax=unclassified Mesorhizobium TaxID=325217 RepID=UPI0003CEADC9|nr:MULTISPECIES: hypothetical protein [unclassified Mesorhizobium]ESX91809.1 hypothetical protein X754_23315 [Mesorhizobium sp. LNJC403B00]
MQQYDRAAAALSISRPADQIRSAGLVEHDALDGQIAGSRQSLPRRAGDQHRADVRVEAAAGSAQPDQRDREQNAKLHCRPPGNNRRLIRTDTG